jgi:hypothetical protein
MFDEKYNEYFNTLLEADPVPTPQPDPAAGGGGAPAPDMGAGGGAPAPDQPEKSPEEKMDEIEKKSGKSWVSLASILASVIETPFTPEDVEQINAELPAGITLDDFAHYSENISKEVPNQMEPEKLANMQSAAIKMFDNVKQVLNRRNPGETVPRAEDMG